MSEGLLTQTHIPASCLPAQPSPAYTDHQAVLPVRLYLHISQGSVCHTHTSSVYILLLSEDQKDSLHPSSSGTMQHCRPSHRYTGYALSLLRTALSLHSVLSQEQSV